MTDFQINQKSIDGFWFNDDLLLEISSAPKLTKLGQISAVIDWLMQEISTERNFGSNAA